MSTKKIELPGAIPVTLQKRSQNRSLRLSITSSGAVRVTLPRWTPFSAAQAFAHSQLSWIQAELAKQTPNLIENGQRVGKLHYVRFEHVFAGQSLGSRVTATEIVVRLLPGEVTSDPTVQQRAQTAAVRALRREAKRLLAPRLAALATKHDLHYSSVAVKTLRRRWGSCDTHGAITLNLYLMELPWEYVDYVLLHELAHTAHMNHGPEFWALLLRLEPNARALSKRLRRHQPQLGNWQP